MENIRWVKLKEIAKIQNGYQKRMDFDNYENKDVKIIKGRNINIHNEIDWDNLSSIKINRNVNNYLIQKGDILFQARGEKHRFIYINENINNIIASHTFFIIRIIDNNVMPEYVCIIFNSNSMQKLISFISGGVIISFVSSIKLGNIKIPIPDKEMQNTIIELNNVFEEKQRILNELNYKYNVLFNGIINNNFFKGDKNEK